MRGVVNGRRNYLFAGADSGGERAATMYSLTGTAKRNGIDPDARLRHVLTHITDHPVNHVNDFPPPETARNRSQRLLPQSISYLPTSGHPHLMFAARR